MKRIPANQGIMVGGSGRLQAEVLAVGTRARASKQVSESGAVQVRTQLAQLQQKIEEQGARIPDADRLKEAVAAVAAELERDRPSGLAMTSILDGIAHSTKKVTGVAKAALDLKILIAQLFV